MSNKQIIGGLLGFIVFTIPLVFLGISIFSSGIARIVGMILSFLCLVILMTKDFKELGAELSKLKFWVKR
ncbi:MAG: hypothetical protein AABW89_01215 [Nanoarchaeota archaeon]